MSPHNTMEIAKRAIRAERERIRRASDPQKCRSQEKARREKDPQKYRDQEKARRIKDPQKFSDQAKARRAKDPQGFRDRAKARREKDPQKFRDQASAKRAKDPERARACGRVADAKRRANDSQKIKDKADAFRAKYPDRIRAYGRASDAKRRSRTLSAAGHGYASKAMIDARWEMFGGKCWVCGGPAEAVDHVKPLSKGGSNFPSNLRPACTGCNSSKGAKWPYPTTTKARKA